MSRADERRQAQNDYEQDAMVGERPAETTPMLPPASSDPHSWASHCGGWRFGVHEKQRVEPNGQWRCRWCWQQLNPPTDQDMVVNRERFLAAPTQQRLRRR